MSRTYRNQIRRYFKYRGVIYNSYRRDASLKGKARQYKVIDWNDPEDAQACWDGGRFWLMVKVGDADCYRRFPEGVKTMCHRKDRARLRQALYRNPEDVHYVPSFDPWYWD